MYNTLGKHSFVSRPQILCWSSSKRKCPISSIQYSEGDVVLSATFSLDNQSCAVDFRQCGLGKKSLEIEYDNYIQY